MRETSHVMRIVVGMELVDRQRQASAALLRDYLSASATQRTILVRQVAEHMVDAREQFLRADGSPDWKGRTYAYRQWVGNVFADAGVPPEQLRTVQSAVRYHVGAVLRERWDHATLAEYGLIDKTPRERSADRRTARSAVIQALEQRELAGGALIGLSAAMGVLAKISTDEVSGLDEVGAAAASAALREISARVETLRHSLP